MRLVATRRLEDGAQLARDVLTGQYGEVPLLRAGVAISARYRDALLRAGVHAVYVDDELGRGIEVPEILSERTRDEATSALARALEAAPAIHAAGMKLPVEMLEEMNRIAALIAADVAASGDAVMALNDLAVADAYTLQHSVDVAALGLLIARRLFADHGWINFKGRRQWDRTDHRLTQLGLGLLLHDIGKLTIPQAILHKPGRLDEGEWEIMRTHPEAGLDLLPSDVIGVLPKVVVRQHHERWAGGGYPDARAGDRIHQFARIAAVADVYDAITSQRPYAGTKPAHVGVEAILAGRGTEFDPEVVDVFRRIVPPYPVGIEIVLSDGRRGAVASVALESIGRPVVRIGYDAAGRRVDPYELDLRDRPDLALTTPPADVPARLPRPQLFAGSRGALGIAV